MKTRTSLLLAAALLASFAVACSRQATPTPTSTATSTPPGATATPTPTKTPALPMATNGAAIPAAVAQIVASVTARDAAPLLALVEYQQVGCTTAQGAGGPPKCKPGDAAGTLYKRFPSGACEGEWAEDASSVISQIVPAVGPLYGAAMIAPPTADSEPFWPKGDTVVMFRSGRAGGSGGYFILSKDRIVRAHILCDRGAGSEESTIKSVGATSYYIAPTAP
ncbi:MAG: hypothetical protein WCI61_06725 [Chloroflexota bacterium]